MQSRILSLLAQWDQAQAEGMYLTPEELSPNDTTIQAELRQRIARRKRLAIQPIIEQQNAHEVVLAPEIPGYELDQPLGKGGMGIVYRARQASVGRTVAIKVLAGRWGDPSRVDRFRREAESLGRLQHPNIVQVFDSGTVDGQPYIVLEFIPGGSLDERLAGQPLSSRAAARVMELLAQAMDTAHRAGIIHRDLKPANVLLQTDQAVASSLMTDDWPSPWIPKIADFGLARIEDGSELTATHSVMGTPSYMAPEQVEGRSDQIGSSADIYALGAMLYEMLTGRPPFRGVSTVETFRLIQETEPPAVRLLQPTVPRDLETVCLKCLQKSSDKRYASAGELAADLRRFLDRVPVLARPVGGVERAWRWCRRRPAVAGLAGTLAVAVVASLTGLSLLYAQSENRRIAADRAAHDAQRALEGKDRVFQFVVEDFGSQFAPPPMGLGEKATMTDILRVAGQRIEQRFSGHLDLNAEMSTMVANMLDRLGDSTTAEIYHRRSLAVQRGFLQPGDPALTRVQNNFGVCLSRQNKLDEAEGILRSALAGRRENGKPEDVGESICNLASVLRKQGINNETKLSEALTLAREASSVFDRALGPDDSYTLTARHLIACLYRDLGRKNEAEAEFAATLERCRQSQPETDENRLSCCNSLALLLKARGEYEKAGGLLRECHAGLLKVYPANHPRVLQVQRALESLPRSSGKSPAAEVDSKVAKLRADYDRARAESGPATLPAAKAYDQLKEQLVAQRRFSDVEELARDRLTDLQTKMSADSPACLMIEWDIAKAIASQTRFEQAIAAYQKCLANARELAKKPLPTSLANLPQEMERGILEQMAVTYDRWEKPDEAARCRQDLEKLKKK